MIKAALLASKKEINVNNNFKKQGVHSDRIVMIVTTVSEFGNIKSIKIQLIGLWQKAVMEFAELEQAKQLTSRWSFLIKKDSVCVTMAVEDQDTWMSKDYFRVLLFTLLVRTTVHDFGTLLDGAGEKTCTRCTIVGFESKNELESAFCTEPIFGEVRLSWAKLDLIWCEKCGKFRHSALKYDASDTLVSVPSKKTVKRNLTKLYTRKNVSISHPAAFDNKSWAQVVSSVISSGDLWFESGSGFGFFSSGASGLSGGFPLVLASNLLLNVRLSSLECSLKLLGNQVSGIMHKLNDMELVPLASSSSSNSLAAPVNVNVDLNSDMVLDSSNALPASSPVVSALGISSSKILTTKVNCLESKLVAFEALIGSVLAKLDQLCAGLDFRMSSASQ
ncbi:hypothetical protein G9A89_023831 [Geosiphon pyriformis]|nr:hypothetical protein G9A89_023831 [Geosiphon pyriformis]